jgi:hypothetical protein
MNVKKYKYNIFLRNTNMISYDIEITKSLETMKNKKTTMINSNL